MTMYIKKRGEARIEIHDNVSEYYIATAGIFHLNEHDPRIPAETPVIKIISNGAKLYYSLAVYEIRG